LSGSALPRSGWNSPKPRIDVTPGMAPHFGIRQSLRQALWSLRLNASRADLRAAHPWIGIRNRRAVWRLHLVLTEKWLPERHDMPMIDPPIRLTSNPPEVIDSTEGAASFMERRDGDAFDVEAAG
jgi:hypothetical protein